MTVSHRDLIITLAALHKLPAVYYTRYLVAAGGLISYGPDVIEQYRQAAGYVDRILKGEKPGDLPVQAPTKYELVINLKTAKTLGLTVPEDVARSSQRGDRVAVPGMVMAATRDAPRPRTQHRFDCCVASSFLAACRSWVISDVLSRGAGWLMFASPPIAPKLGRTRSVAFGRTHVIQTPKLGLEPACRSAARPPSGHVTLVLVKPFERGRGTEAFRPRKVIEHAADRRKLHPPGS